MSVRQPYDAIDTRLRFWTTPVTHAIADRSGTLHFRLAGNAGLWMVTPDGSVARVDGGDPGDEDGHAP